MERGEEVVQVEGFPLEDSLPLSDWDTARGFGGDSDLELTSWDVLVVCCESFAGLDAACRKCKE